VFVYNSLESLVANLKSKKPACFSLRDVMPFADHWWSRGLTLPNGSDT
jgi:hypothetical protein